MTASKYITIFRYVIYFASVFGLIFIATLSGHEYAWLSEMDSGMEELPIDNKVGDRAIIAFLTILFLVGLHTLLIWRSKRTLDQMALAVFGLIAISLWLYKFKFLL